MILPFPILDGSAVVLIMGSSKSGTSVDSYACRIELITIGSVKLIIVRVYKDFIDAGDVVVCIDL